MKPSESPWMLTQQNARRFACKFWGLPTRLKPTLQAKELCTRQLWGAKVTKQVLEPEGPGAESGPHSFLVVGSWMSDLMFRSQFPHL